MVVFSPMDTLGPMIEFLIQQPVPILTGATITVFSNCFASVSVANFLSKVAFDSSNVSLRPQSNQFSTLKDLN